MAKQLLIKPLDNNEITNEIVQYNDLLEDFKAVERYSRINAIKQISDTLERIKTANTSKPEFASAVQRYMVALETELESLQKESIE